MNLTREDKELLSYFERLPSLVVKRVPTGDQIARLAQIAREAIVEVDKLHCTIDNLTEENKALSEALTLAEDAADCDLRGGDA